VATKPTVWTAGHKVGRNGPTTIQVGLCAIGLLIGAAGLRLGLKNLVSSPVSMP